MYPLNPYNASRECMWHLNGCIALKWTLLEGKRLEAACVEKLSTLYLTLLKNLVPSSTAKSWWDMEPTALQHPAWTKLQASTVAHVGHPKPDSLCQPGFYCRAAPGHKYQQRGRKRNVLQAATLVLSTSCCLLPPLLTPKSFWSCTYRTSGTAANTTQNSG